VGILKGVADAGQGGKLGHSNMDHWVFNEQIKTAARRRRRLNAKREIALGLSEQGDLDEEVSGPTLEKDRTAGAKSD